MNIDIAATLNAAIKANVVPYLEGPPGIGKTAQVRQYAADNGLDLIIYEASLRDTTDLLGIPTPGENGKVKWLTPGDLPYSGRGILFLDDLPAAPPEIFPALLRLLLDRQVGSYTLPEGWHIVAAGNRQQDRAGALSLNSAVINRLFVIPCVADVQHWHDWAKHNGVDADIRHYILSHPDKLHMLEETDSDGCPFPSPRSWAAASRLIKAGLPKKQALAGTVGEQTAEEFLAWLEIRQELPTLGEILREPHDCHVPENPLIQLELAKSLASRQAQDFAKKVNAVNSLKAYVERMHEEAQNLYDVQRSSN